MYRAGDECVLVVDDDPDFHGIVQHLLRVRGESIRGAQRPQDISAALNGCSPAVILLDWQLGEYDGTELIESLRRHFPLAPVVFVTAHNSPDVAATSIKLGAFDFLNKPLEAGRLLVTIAKAIEHHELLKRLHRYDSGDENGFEGMLGASPQMRTIYATIRNVAPTNVNVMICGESGTGKELVAAALHQRSDRAAGPFVGINVAAIPGELAESTLFGHERGAFTGADRGRSGAVGEAAKGTLFLDEITEMPIDLQGKLLRFLQDRTYRPVGGGGIVASDVRILSATNREPAEAVREHRLREDLYYRLNVIPIQLPPLREREGDISLLAYHALRQYSAKHGKSFQEIDPQALESLERHRWPGNVRELLHAMERIVVLHHGQVVERFMLPPEVLGGSTRAAAAPAALGAAPSRLARRDAEEAVAAEAIIPLEEVERRALERALQLCDGSAYEAARRLKISAATIYRKIKLYGLRGD